MCTVHLSITYNLVLSNVPNSWNLFIWVFTELKTIKYYYSRWCMMLCSWFEPSLGFIKITVWQTLATFRTIPTHYNMQLSHLPVTANSFGINKLNMCFAVFQFLLKLYNLKINIMDVEVFWSTTVIHRYTLTQPHSKCAA